jgi:hypothetical protein
MHLKKLALASSALLFHTTLVAQEEAGSIDLGGFELFPSLTVTHALDDNVTRTATGEIDSWKRIVSPELVLLNDFGGNTLQFGYRLERGDYFSSSQDDYTDHFISALYDYEINSRHRAKVTGEYEDGHDDRGTSFSIGTGNALETPDQYKSLNGELVYSYGALTADARLDFILGYRDLDYDRSEEVYLARDRDFVTLGGIFYYQVAPATDLVVDVSQTEVTYDYLIEGAETLDSTNSSILVGVQWESTAATSGFAKIGYQQKDFDSALREEFSGFDWELGVTWQPIDRSTIEFSTRSDTNETNGEGNFIQRRSYGAVWKHEWLDRVSSRASFAFIDDIYEGSVNNREDDITQLSLAVDYQFRRWLKFELAYQYDERESTVETIDYDRNLISIGVNITL